MDKKIIQKPLVSYLDAELKEAAENFSKRHNLRFCTPREIRKSFSSNLIILITNKGIFLQDLSLKNSKPFDLNFISFREKINNKNLIEKCFLKFDKKYRVYDLSAGFCFDAFIISSLGFNVQAYEKESWLFEFTLENLKKDRVKNIKLINKNSLDILEAIQPKSIIYLDPMFDVDNKSFAKKEMHFLRRSLLVDSEDLLENALNSRAELVVLKKHRLDDLKTEKKPSFKLIGKVVSLNIFDRRN